MSRNLLVIDRTHQAATLIRTLEQEGYFCFQARGPLRVRTLLDEQEIDLIVWREEAAHPELTEDLIREWSHHPQIPVVHLFPREAAHTGFIHHPQIRRSLPGASPPGELTAIVQRLLGGTPGTPPVLQRTELAFRNVVEALRNAPDPLPSERGHLDSSDIRAQVTSVIPAERQGLTRAPAPEVPGFSPWRWITRYLHLHHTAD